MDLSAVLFDMDGVLIDTDAAIAGLWHGLAGEYGTTISPADLAAHVYGCVPEHTVETVFAALGTSDRAHILRRVREAEPTLGFTPVPQAADLVRRLAAAGVPLALVTGASATRAGRTLDALGLTGRFAATVTWGEAARGKPAPDCYLLAAERLGVPAQACLVFEDTTGGVRAATAAGAACVAVGPADPAALRAHGARHAVPGFQTVRFHDSPAGAVLAVADEEFRFAPAAAFAVPDHTEGL
jgi:HAD superfamily hydrolase (TIGR01509 family)